MVGDDGGFEKWTFCTRYCQRRYKIKKGIGRFWLVVPPFVVRPRLPILPNPQFKLCGGTVPDGPEITQFWWLFCTSWTHFSSTHTYLVWTEAHIHSLLAFTFPRLTLPNCFHIHLRHRPPLSGCLIMYHIGRQEQLKNGWRYIYYDLLSPLTKINPQHIPFSLSPSLPLPLSASQLHTYPIIHPRHLHFNSNSTPIQLQSPVHPSNFSTPFLSFLSCLSFLPSPSPSCTALTP